MNSAEICGSPSQHRAYGPGMEANRLHAAHFGIARGSAPADTESLRAHVLAADEPAPQRPRKATIPGLIRGFGVTLGGSAILVAVALASVASAVLSLAQFQAPSTFAAAGTVLAVVYVAIVRPWHLTWGSNEQDIAGALPGDDLLSGGRRINHAVAIDAPRERVWPWLAQIGQDRGGFYSYEWLENLAGCEMQNATRIHPEWQRRVAGETIFLHPTGGLEVSLFEPGRAIGIRNWGTFTVVDDGERGCRLVARGEVPSGPFGALYSALFEIPHFIMERKMLLGIKKRAEAEWAES